MGVRDGFWFWEFFFAFCSLGRKKLAGTVQSTHFLSLIRFSVSGVLTKRAVFGWQILGGMKKEVSTLSSQFVLGINQKQFESLKIANRFWGLRHPVMSF